MDDDFEATSVRLIIVVCRCILSRSLPEDGRGAVGRGESRIK